MALPVLIPDHPLDELDPDRLPRTLVPYVPAAAAVCGPDSAFFRLLSRAVYSPHETPELEAKRLRLAHLALTQQAEETKARLRAWPHSLCSPNGGHGEHDA